MRRNSQLDSIILISIPGFYKKTKKKDKIFLELSQDKNKE